MIAAATAAVALACVDGAGNLEKIDVEGVMRKLRHERTPFENPGDSRNGINMQPHGGEEVHPSLPLQLLRYRLRDSHQSDLPSASAK